VRYVLNSAVITAPGVYAYRRLTVDQARAWLRQGPVVSRVGYPETLAYLRDVLGVTLPLSREATAMAIGDEALVVRLRYRLPDAGLKGRAHPGAADWELGLLLRER
jgi:hypothetical protein